MRLAKIFSLLSLCLTGVLANTCEDLKSLLKKQRFFTVQDRDAYCEAGCTFGKVDCSSVLPFGIDLKYVAGALYNVTLKYANGEIDPPVFMPVFDSASNKEIVLQSLKFFLPYLSAILPILAQHLAGGCNAYVVAFNLLYIIVGLLTLLDDWKKVLHALVYVYVGSVIPVSSRFFQDIAITYLSVLLLAVGSVGSSNSYVGLVFGFLVVGVFSYYVRQAVMSRSEAQRVLVLLNGLMLLVVSEYLYFLTTQMAMESTGIAFLKLFVEAVLPYGSHSTVTANAVQSAYFLASVFNGEANVKVGVFAFGFFAYITIFVLVRAVIGSLVLSTLKFKLHPRSLIVGLYSYSIDVVGPWNVLLNIVGWFKDKTSERRFMYGLIVCALSAFEFKCGHDYVLVKLIMFGVDLLFVDSGLGNVSKFLEFDFDFSAVSFPKPGAFPYFSLHHLNEIAKYVVPVSVILEDSGGNPVQEKRGVGLLRSDERGFKHIVSVKHVFDDANRCQFNGETAKVHGVNYVGCSTDAVTVVDVDKRFSGCDIAFLSEAEKRSVSHLFVISPGSPCALIDTFTFDPDGDILASVNLTHGDSGSPVVAVLENGLLRLAGVVSRGAYNYGSPNLLSSVLGKTAKGSPGSLNPYYDITQSGNSQYITRLSELMLENKNHYDEFFKELDDWRAKRQDFDENDRREEREKDGEYWEKAKAKVKNWKKNRAFKKRAVLFDEVLSMTSFSADLKEQLRESLSEGDIIEFNMIRKERMGFDAAAKAGLGF